MDGGWNGGCRHHQMAQAALEHKVLEGREGCPPATCQPQGPPPSGLSTAVRSGQVRPGQAARPGQAGRVIRTAATHSTHQAPHIRTPTHSSTTQSSLTHSLEPRGDQHSSRDRARARAILVRPLCQSINRGKGGKVGGGLHKLSSDRLPDLIQNMHHIARDIERIPYIGEVVEGKVVHK